MIQVAVRSGKLPAVAEFFELFKTEWSVYDSSEPCTILLTDGSAPLDASAALYILATPAACDGESASRTATPAACGSYQIQLADGTELPLYHTPRLFDGVEPVWAVEKETGSAVVYSATRSGKKIVRIGYDLFDEVEFLLTRGQPLENAGLPTLDRHIGLLRQTILHAGFPVVEIPPCPPGHDFMVCLTHDVDFVSLRAHGFDSTIRGFLYRAVFGSVMRFVQQRMSVKQLLKNWGAALSLPLVHLGICDDFWMQFAAYRRIEKPYRSTFFLIPFKDRPGKNVTEPHPERRAARYDVMDVIDEASDTQSKGWEIGLHGIDACQDQASAGLEKKRIESALNQSAAGVRMHWLCLNAQSLKILDDAGFEYDSTVGYNETIGFRAGTSQVFKPLSAKHLLELPLHIQDVALFYPAFLDLAEPEAWRRCMALLDHQKANGGVVTVLWHMRSLAPERLWGEFYKRLLDAFAHANAWVGTARETADWFRARRQLKISTVLSSKGLTVSVENESAAKRVEMTIRVYHPDPHGAAAQPVFTDQVWSGQSELLFKFPVADESQIEGGVPV